MRVLITNGNSRMALCLARALKKKGHDIVVSDYVKNSLCFFSNKKSDHFIYPSPYSNPEAFIKTIIHKVKELKIDVLFPVHEETFLISKYSSELKEKVSIVVPDYKALLSVHNKDKLYELLISKSIKTPKTLPLERFENFDLIAEEFLGQIVLKPKQGGGNWGLFVPDINISLEAQIKNYLNDTKIDISRVLVQEWVPTSEKFSHVVIYQNGKLIQDFADIHLRDFPLNGGSGVLRKSCDATPMTQISQKLFDQIGWHGLAEVEYVTHAETGEYYLIEINPRVWGGVNSAISSDLDIVGIYLDISQDIKVQSGLYNFGTQTRWFWGDMRVFPEYYRRSNSKLSALSHYFSLLVNSTKTDEFYWDDPLPFFVWPCHAIYKMLKSRSLKPVSYDSLSGEWE